MTNQDKKEIKLTKDQYMALAKAVYLGNWMANAQRDGSSEEPVLKEYEEITDYIFSLATEFGFSKNFEHDLECGEGHMGTTEVCRIHEEYDEEVMWDELCEQLGERDFYKKYTDEQIKKMSREEHFTKLQECIILYEYEMSEHGLERLHVVKQAKDFGIHI